MPASVTELVELLQIEQLEVNLFRGGQPRETRFQRVYGGQVAGQAVMAAQQTVQDDKQLHSLHVYFILGGDPSIPIVYDVDNVRDGRSFATRRVAARQHGEVIFYMTASFQREEQGWEHQDAIPATPGPDEATSMLDLLEYVSVDGIDGWQQEWGAFDMRYAGDPRAADDPTRAQTPVVQRMWWRTRDRLADDDLLHRAVFAYYSDFSLLGAALTPHGEIIGSPRVQSASLDHVIWYHRPFRVDEWLLYDQTSPSASGARGLALGRVFTQDGRLVATVAQEGVLRRARPRSDR